MSAPDTRTFDPARPSTRLRDATPLCLTYTNHRGETSVRRIVPLAAPVWQPTEWHPETQWILRAFDVDKQEEREFALKGFAGSDPAPPAASAEDDAAIDWKAKALAAEAERAMAVSANDVLNAEYERVRKERDVAEARLADRDKRQWSRDLSAAPTTRHVWGAFVLDGVKRVEKIRSLLVGRSSGCACAWFWDELEVHPYAWMAEEDAPAPPENGDEMTGKAVKKRQSIIDQELYDNTGIIAPARKPTNQPPPPKAPAPAWFTEGDANREWNKYVNAQSGNVFYNREQQAFLAGMNALAPRIDELHDAAIEEPDTLAVVRLLVEALEETRKLADERDAPEGSAAAAVLAQAAAALSDPRLVRLLADGETGR